MRAVIIFRDFTSELLYTAYDENPTIVMEGVFMKYLVQAILIDGDIERVNDSIKTDEYEVTLDFVMKRHKTSDKYFYIVMEIETQKIIIKTKENKFYLWKGLTLY